MHKDHRKLAVKPENKQRKLNIVWMQDMHEYLRIFGCDNELRS